jgi:hypothetical protein
MKRSLLYATILLLAAAFAAAQDKPNLSGKWVLDLSKSNFEPLPAPDSQVRVIDHKEPKLRISETTKDQRGERTRDREITTDGKENKTTVGPNEYVSKSRWDGNRLITEGTLKLENGTNVDIKETAELSDDGNVMTLKRELKSPQGEATQKLTFNKQ